MKHALPRPAPPRRARGFRLSRGIYKLRRNFRTLSWAVRNVVAGQRVRRELVRSSGPIRDLGRYERRFTSQNGEDGILEALLAVLNGVPPTFVEFGAGTRCNALRLATTRTWTGLWMDPRGPWRGAPLPVEREFVTAENVEALLDRHGVPRDLGLLVIDIDGNDWWVWRALESRRPRIVVIEYNAHQGPDESSVIPYDPAFAWDRTDFYGASLLAMARLGNAKRYALVGCDASGTNAFFVAREHLSPRVSEATVARAWRAPHFSAARRWLRDPRPRLLVDVEGRPYGVALPR